MIPEARIERTATGLVPVTDGWYVLNAAEAPWRERPGRGAFCELEGDVDFPQLGINIQVLGPGEPMAMYHWEADQENFLVLAGAATLVVEGEERSLRQWDFVHCPPGANHVIVGAGDAPCVILAAGGRIDSTGPNWGGYRVDETAGRLGASVEEETTDPKQAYARFPPAEQVGYRVGWLPE
ncbi:MAG: hypothetical protein QOH74_398 [Gaiellales bacterium]|nr:hypothetical protein [Gaiellales bacterium]